MWNAVYRRPLGELTGIQPTLNEVPNQISLSQNYPNPFNPETNIEFQIPAAGNILLTIYDMLGREIAVLINEKLDPGSYKVGWNASQYASGVYYYELRTMDFSSVKKMIIIR